MKFITNLPVRFWREYRAILLIAGVSLVMKVFLWHCIHRANPVRFFLLESYADGIDETGYRDSIQYHDAARSLLQLHAFSASPEKPEIPQTIRTPGYPLFLAAVYLVAGVHPSVAVLAQVFLGAVTVIMTFALGARLFGRRAGLLAGALVAFDLNSIGHSLFLYAETLFTFVMVGVAWVGVRLLSAERRPGLAMFAWLGLLLAVSAYCRPVSLYLAIWLAPFFVLVWLLRRRRFVEAVSGPLVLLMSALLVIGAWMMRNQARTGAFEFSEIVGFNALDSTGCHIVAHLENITPDQARERMGFHEMRRRYFAHPEERWGAWATAKYRDLVLAHPWVFLRVTAGGVRGLLWGYGAGELPRLLGVDRVLAYTVSEKSAVGAVLPAWDDAVAYACASVFERFYLVFLLAGVLASIPVLLLCAGGDSRVAGAFLGWLVLYFLLVSGGEAYFRFRVPITPFLAILSVCGWQGLRQWVRRVRNPLFRIMR